MRRALSLIAVLPALTLAPLVGTAVTATPALADGSATQLYWSTGTSPSTAVIHTRSQTGSVGSYLTGGFHPQLSPNGNGLVFQEPGPSDPFSGSSLWSVNTAAGTSSELKVAQAGTGQQAQVIQGFDIQDDQITDPYVPPTDPDPVTGVRPRASDGNPGGVIYDLATTGGTCQLNVINADATDPISSYYPSPTCASNPAWGGDTPDADTDSAYYASRLVNYRLEQGSHQDGVQGAGHQDYANTHNVISPSQGIVPAEGGPYDRSVFTEIVQPNDASYPGAPAGAHAVRYINDGLTNNSSEGLGNGAYFDATNQVDAWHFASDGKSVISAASYKGINGIWRLDPANTAREPELLDGVYAKDAQWVTRPTPGAVLISSSFPTSIPDSAGTQDFTTSIDNSSDATKLTSVTIDVDLAVAAGTRASDVTLTNGSTAVPLTLSGTHLTGSFTTNDVNATSVVDLPMHLKVNRAVPGGSWVATFGVTASPAPAVDVPGVRSRATVAPTLQANAFIPSTVQGGLATATALTATPATGGTTTPITVVAKVTVPGSESSSVPAGGSVQFAVDNTLLGSPVAINASGVATAPVQTYAVGTHTFQALYLGYDPGTASGQGYQESVSGKVTVTIAAPAPLSKPNAPFITGIAPKPGKLLPAWIAPTTGAPVTGYTITCTRIKGLQVVTASTAATVLTTTFSGLLNNADYLCSVVAHSAVGDSPTSNVVKARPGKLPAVTLTVVKKAKKGSTITLTGTATAAGQPMTDRTITLSFRKSTGSTRTDIDTTKTDKKGHFTFKTILTTSGAYQATMVLGASTTRDKEKFVRAK